MTFSDILYVYEGKLVNPNGDPASASNAPRLNSNKYALVSPLRIKRNVRDFIYKYCDLNSLTFIDANGNNKYEYNVMFRLNDDNKHTTIDQMFTAQGFNTNTKAEEVFRKFADLRIFGAQLSFKAASNGASATHSPMHLTGAVQFDWGISVAPVKILNAMFTSIMGSSGKEEVKGGNFGLHQSIIEHAIFTQYGTVDGFIPEYRDIWDNERVVQTDLKLLDFGVIFGFRGIRSSSKSGVYSRVYLRIDYDKQFTSGDVSHMIKWDKDAVEESDWRGLYSYLTTIKDSVQTVHIWMDPSLAESFTDGVYKGLCESCGQDKVNRISLDCSPKFTVSGEGKITGVEV